MLGGSSGEPTSMKFQQLSSKFTRLVHGRSEGDREQINILFDELNALDFKSVITANSAAAVLLINQCCSIVPPNDTFLVAKGCQLISNLVIKQEVKVEGKTLAVAINWIIQSLKYCADIALLDILLALDAILKGNGNNIANDTKDLLGPNTVFMSFLDPIKSNNLKLALPWEVHLATVKCLESLTFLNADIKIDDEEKCTYLESCLEIFIKQFNYERVVEQDENNYCKILIVSMKGIQNVIQQSPDLLSENLGDLLGVVKAYMLYGLPGHSGLIPQRIFSAHVGVGQSELRSSTGQASGKGSKSTRTKKQRKSQHKKKSEMNSKICLEDGNDNQDGKKIANAGFRLYTSDNNKSVSESNVLYPQWLKTSESDFSDTEGGQASKIRNNQGRVRQAALTLLLSTIKLSERRVFFGYWSSLLPAGPSTPQTRTLITCLLKDPSARSRMAVLNVVTSLLLGSRLYLLQAEHSKKPSTSFTPFSISLGYMVNELHRSLCLALIAEHSTPVVTHLLKCIAALVQNTPYHRLEAGLITKIIRNVRGFLKHKDSNVHVAALTVLGSIATVEPPVPEISEQLGKPLHSSSQDQASAKQTDGKVPTEKLDYDLLDEMDNEYMEDEDYDVSPMTESTNRMSWLLQHCLDILSDPSDVEKGSRSQTIAATPVKIESLQVLAVLSKIFFAPIISMQLSAVVKVLQFAANDTDLVIHRHVGHVIEGIGLSIQQSLQSTTVPKPITLDTSVEFWQTMLTRPVTSMIQNADDTTLRTVGCDCLASIGSDVFQELKRDKQILIVTILFGCCQDEDHNVRSSSVRALAMCILFPVLREDIHFVIDTAESVIRALKDESLSVRVKASWSLGNLSDALVLNSKAQMEEIPNTLLLELLASSITASQDNDKVRSNAVRSVGNLLLLYTNELIIKAQFRETADKAINTLVRNATNGNNMKVRWNACYAIGNMLKNTVLYQENSACLASVYSTLTGLVVNFKNFKVRINAAVALATPATRLMYGPHFIQIWEGLMNGLDNSQNMEDFNEYKHQDNLINQICSTLIHMMTLVTPEDLSPLLDLLSLHLETVQTQMSRFHQRVVPEKEGDLMTASHHATSLLQLPAITSEQRTSASLLVKIFSQDTIQKHV